MYFKIQKNQIATDRKGVSLSVAEGRLNDLRMNHLNLSEKDLAENIGEVSILQMKTFEGLEVGVTDIGDKVVEEEDRQI